MRRTIRFRVTLVATLLVLVLLAVVGSVVAVIMRSQLRQNLDDDLHRRGDAYAALVAGQVSVLPVGDDTLVRVIHDNGETNIFGQLDSSPRWPDTTPVVRMVRSVDGRAQLRVLTMAFETPTGPATLQIAVGLDDVNDPTHIAIRTLEVVLPLAALLLAILVWWLTGRALRPVEAIRSELADITVHNLSRRVPEPGTGDEIDRLARTANATLAELDRAVTAQQRLVADASHELRTPLARMRAALELDAAQPSSADVVRTHHDVLADTVALQRLIEDLLYLARSDATPRRDVPDGRVDLRGAVHEEVAALADGVHVDLAGVEFVEVRGSGPQLARVVRNLLENARRHAVSTITVTLGELDGAAQLGVSDDGEGVPADQRDAVFQRFTRLDDARSTDTGGAGLGLAIARDIVERHGGTIRIDGDHASRFVVTLPLIRPAK